MAASAAIAEHAIGVAEAAEVRSAPRRPLRLAVATDGSAGAIVLRNLSRTGMMIECRTALERGELIEIAIPEIGMRSATVRWSDGALYGCHFDEPIPAAAISAALLRAEPLGGPDRATVYAMEEDDAAIEKLSLPARMRTIMGLAVLSWGALVAAAVATL